MIYFSPLFFFVPSLLFFLARDKRAGLPFNIIFFFYFSIFCGLRYFCDVDYQPYFDLYAQVPPLDEFSLRRIQGLHGEFGYLLFSSLFRFLGVTFPWFALFVSVLSIGGKIYFAQKVTGAGFYVLNLYFFFCFIIVEFIQVRWGMAIAFLSIGYYFYFRSKLLLAFLFLALAVANHYYSVLFVALLPLVGLLRAWQCWLVFFGCFAIALVYKLFGFSLSLFSDSSFYIVQRLLRYLNDPTSNVGGFSLAKCLYYLFCVVFLVRLNPAIKQDGLTNFLVRSGLLIMSAALFLSFVPIFFLRAMFVADFIFISIIVRLVGSYFSFGFRFFFMLIFVVPLIVWSFIDLNGSLSVGRIWEYQSWLGLWF